MEFRLLHFRHTSNSHRHAFILHDKPRHRGNALEIRHKHFPIQRQFHRGPLSSIHHSIPQNPINSPLRLRFLHFPRKIDLRQHVLNNRGYHIPIQMQQNR